MKSPMNHASTCGAIASFGTDNVDYELLFIGIYQSDNLIYISSQYIPHQWRVLFARSDWLTRRWLASTIHLRATGGRDFQLFRPLVTHKITFWSANYSACVVYTKTIIHLSVGESDGYLPPLDWIIANYLNNQVFRQRKIICSFLIFSTEAFSCNYYFLFNK